MPLLTDKQLREFAHKRVAFKSHLLVYAIVNTAFWTIWYVTGRGYMWPIWPMAGWGIGVIFHYLFDYRSSQFLSEEEEYEHLKERQQHSGLA